MADVELLEKVKVSLGITGNYQNDTLQLYIDEVKEYLRSAGVAENVLRSTTSVGIIIRGVADLWNYGTGNTQLSEYFYQRAKQLLYIDS